MAQWGTLVPPRSTNDAQPQIPQEGAGRVQLRLDVDANVKRQIVEAANERGCTLRTIVLEALKGALREQAA